MSTLCFKFSWQCGELYGWQLAHSWYSVHFIQLLTIPTKNSLFSSSLPPPVYSKAACQFYQRPQTTTGLWTQTICTIKQQIILLPLDIDLAQLLICFLQYSSTKTKKSLAFTVSVLAKHWCVYLWEKITFRTPPQLNSPWSTTVLVIFYSFSVKIGQLVLLLNLY